MQIYKFFASTNVDALTVAIIYIYNDIEVQMWVNFEQKMCKIMHFFYFAPTGANAYI